MISKSIKAYLRLGRVHSSVLTGVTPCVVAAATGTTLSLYHYLGLFIIGISLHISGFVFNELNDLPIDKTSDKLQGKPLVDESISTGNAKKIIIFSVIFALILTVVLFKEKAIILIPVIFLMYLFGGLYDIIGKHFPHSDYFIALSVFFIGIYGGLSVTYNLSFLVYVICALAFVQMLAQNIVAGIKDVDHDFKAGGISTPLRMGVKIKGENIIIPKSFIAYIVALKIIHVTLIFIPFYYRLIYFENWQVYIVIILAGLTIFFMTKVLTIRLFDREKIMRVIGFHEMFAFMVVPFIIFSFIGILGLLILIFLPILWLGVFLILIYGKLMPEI